MEDLDEGLHVFNKFCSFGEWKCQWMVQTIKGLRPRDPFFPFLFTIAVHVLRRMLLRVEERISWKGSWEGGIGPKVTHL